MNIYQISQELLSLFDEIEENGGELTPELEEQLNVTQETFKDKVKSYVGVIQQYENELKAIKEEKARLDKLKKTKEKTIERLKKVVVEAIDNFGDVKNSGVKFVDYGTGQVSIRKTQAVEVNDDIVNHVATCLHFMFGNERYNNQLDVVDRIDKNWLIDEVASTPSCEDLPFGYRVTEDDLNHILLDVACLVPLSEVINGGKGFNAIREMMKFTQATSIEGKVVKSAIKPELEQDGSCAPHIARLVTNKNISIK